MYFKKLFFRFNLLFIYLTIFVFLLLFVVEFSVNVPFWDQWALVEFFEKIATGKVTFVDFIAQHNEHRILFPRIIFAILAFLSNWSIRYELYFSIFLAAITFWILAKISALQFEGKRKSSGQLINSLTCILICSLLQYENWLWGFQIAWFLINTCFVIAVLLITLSNNSPIRFYLAAIPCFIASFSSAHGLLTWLAVIPSIASLNSNYNQRIKKIIVWISFFVITCSIYFIGYQKPSNHPSIFFLLKEPLVAGKYFLTLLGTPLAHQPAISPVIGLIILLIFLLLTAHFATKSQLKFQVNSEAAPWISIGLFALLFALMTTIGRAGFGVEQSTASRYTTSSILLIIATVQLWGLLSSINGFFAGIITGLLFINSVDVIPQASLLSQERQASKTCLELVNFMEASLDSCLKDLFPSPSKVKELAPILEKLGFRKFPKEVAFITEPSKVHGYIDYPPTQGSPFIFSESGSLNMAGWAILPNSVELPKTVFLSYANKRSFFANAIVNLDSPDVAKALNSSRFNKVRWSVNISAKSLPLGETVIKVWVYDAARKQLIKLNGEPKVKVVK